MKTKAGTITLAAVCALVVAACDADQGASVEQLDQGKWGTGEVLTDLGPMLERVPALAGATSVAYVGGTRTAPEPQRDTSVPGPSDLWIDAVVAFDAGDERPSLECAGGAATAGTPDVVQELSASLDDGPWVACAPGAFAAPGWTVSASFSAGANVVVLNMATM